MKKMKKVFEVNEKCERCNGTGLYVGLAKQDGAAVVCHTCNGTGCRKFRHEYEEFTARIDKPGVMRVYQTNPGICIGAGSRHQLEDFGGMALDDWKSGKPFIPGMENRKFTCPCWWYQYADYKLKPEWKECQGCGAFSSCPNFTRKEQCWKRWDKENAALSNKTKGE
jgi:hypothetical protein